MKITINKNTIETDQTSLKILLEERGFAFPCKARGVCGKCRINCKDLAPTDRDKRFLSKEEIEDGVRLACDKIAVDGLEITAKIAEQVKITECDGYAVIGDNFVEVGIVQDSLWERSVFEGDFADKKSIESVIAHGTLDFLEKYDVAKTTTLYIIGKKKKVETLLGDSSEDGFISDGATFRLPSDEVNVLPTREEDGSDSLIMKKSGLSLDEAVLKVIKDIRFRVKL